MASWVVGCGSERWWALLPHLEALWHAPPHQHVVLSSTPTTGRVPGACYLISKAPLVCKMFPRAEEPFGTRTHSVSWLFPSWCAAPCCAVQESQVLHGAARVCFRGGSAADDYETNAKDDTLGRGVQLMADLVDGHPVLCLSALFVVGTLVLAGHVARVAVAVTVGISLEACGARHLPLGHGSTDCDAQHQLHTTRVVVRRQGEVFAIS